MELQGDGAAPRQWTARAVATHPSGPLPEAPHRVGQTPVKPTCTSGMSMPGSNGAGRWRCPGSHRPARPPRCAPGAFARTVRRWRPGLYDDGLLGDAAGGLDARRSAFRQLTRSSTKAMYDRSRIVADHLAHRVLEVPPPLVVGGTGGRRAARSGWPEWNGVAAGRPPPGSADR